MLRTRGVKHDAAARSVVPLPLLFALIFSIIWLLHAPLLRLPYFWDEAGYFIPAARDLLLTGSLIPSSTVSNAHPPLVMAWLAFWWKFSAYTPAVTRTAMLLVTAFALVGVFRLTRQVCNAQVAAAATLLTALFPVFFAQSSLAHLDMAAAAFTIWGLSSYLKKNIGRATIWFALAGIAKETALIAPFALFGWELLQRVPKFRTLSATAKKTELQEGAQNAQESSPSWRSLILLLSAVPLACWLAYHYAHTGIVFGNPEYFRYNVGATLNPLRVVLALLQRVWQLLGYLNMFVLTASAALALGYSPLQREGHERPRIAPSTITVFAVVILSYLVILATVGGAVLARYLLPVYPLMIIACVATLWRRVSWWPVAVGIVAVAFVTGLFVAPPYRISPEDNLTYAHFVRLHKEAAERISALPEARVLTAWPATDELTRPYLGYVSKPVPVVPIEHFTLDQLMRARKQEGRYSYAFVFSTKYDSGRELPKWLERTQERLFDFHRDLPPQAAADVLGGRILHQERRGGEWIAIMSAGRASEIRLSFLGSR